jgi:glutathione S-transferase
MHIPRLHTFAPFDRGAKARWLLHCLGIPFDDRQLDRKKKENESPEYLALNPQGRVPVLEFGDTVIFESGAICLYLADLHPEKGLAPKPTDALRPLYLQWMFFASATLDTIQTRIMVIEDIEEGSDLRNAKESALMQDWRDALEALDRALAEGPHLLGRRLSAADICVSYHLYRCTLWPELDTHIDSFPKVRDYLERMKRDPIAEKFGVFSQSG